MTPPDGAELAEACRLGAALIQMYARREFDSIGHLWQTTSPEEQYQTACILIGIASESLGRAGGDAASTATGMEAALRMMGLTP